MTKRYVCFVLTAICIHIPQRGLPGSIPFQAAPNGSHPFLHLYTGGIYLHLLFDSYYLSHLINDRWPFSTANRFFIGLMYIKSPELFLKSYKENLWDKVIEKKFF